MIRSKKHAFIVPALFLLLIMIAVIPAALLDYNRSSLMGDINVMAIQPEPLLDMQSSQEHNVFERIQTMQKSVVEDSNVIVEWKGENIPAQQQQELIHAVENQLSILQELEVMPMFEFSAKTHATLVKKTYIDMENPANTVSIWNIYVSYPTLLVNAYMDAETLKLYDVSVFSETQSLTYASDNPSAQGFLDYLQHDSKETLIGREQFDASGYYTSDTAKIFLVSYNRDTQAVTHYNFEDNPKYVMVTYSEDTPQFDSLTETTAIP